MRFGERLEASKAGDGGFDHEMQGSFLGYDALKQRLQECVDCWNVLKQEQEQEMMKDDCDCISDAGTEADDAQNLFWHDLRREIAKIDTFYDGRFSELKERTEACLSRSPPTEQNPDYEPLKADITSLQKWVELNHIALVKIHKKYVKNAYQTLGEDFSQNLPVIFQRSFFEGDNELSKLKQQVDKYAATLLAKTRCSLCKGHLPCAEVECVAVKQTISEACCRMVPGWSNAQEGSLIIRVLTGGLSNRLFTVDNISIEDTTFGCNEKPDLPSRVIARIFGGGEHVDRDLEATVIKRLSELQIGPATYGEFEGGRLEEFVNGLSLHHYHLARPQVLSQVHQQMADIHNLVIPGISQEPLLFPTLRKYHKLAVQVGFTDKDLQEIPGQEAPIKKADLLVGLGDVAAYEAEIEWLERELLNGDYERDVCFTHGDMQEGNLLVDDPKKSNPEVTVIDYEYARYDYAAFDMANFFCETYVDNFFPEYPFFRIYPQLVINKEQQMSFIRGYLEARRGSPPTEAEVSQWREEVRLLMLGSHLQWGLWSVLQASESDIEFCYLSYAKSRLDEYHRIKAEILSERL
eukprot:TRINITY_DN4583_c2_g1_i1.p1 TRINITY_DN4583_c2_g1~~TRINITY_DN4583_c2_g1_i1.p1  ORF type:complete len:578 (+),score=307.13 TRINITY_DN4583_c2_g1_i1:160-1893(+)